MGAFVIFMMMARDKSLVRIDESQVLVEKEFLDRTVLAARQQQSKTRSKYDEKIHPDEFEGD